ncbi:MAG: glycosyltransferase family 39 protein [Nanoarchaeota archaeon]
MTGAYAYPYLEDDDPWGHAEAAKYVSVEKNFDAKPRFTHYLEPYPPAYPAVMGLIHQTNDSIFDTLKQFNVLLMVLALALFYILTKLLFNRNVALISTIILGIMPSFMSHFIWAQTLAIALSMISLYLIIYFTKEQKNNYFYISIIILASSLTVQTIASAKIGIIFMLLFGCFMLQSWRNKEQRAVTKKLFLIGLFGLVISWSIYWVPALIHQGPEEFFTIAEGFSIFQSASGSSGSMAQYANPIYSLKDIIAAPLSSKIDQATGIGIFTFITLLVGLFFISLRYKKFKEPTILFAILWFAWELISLKSGSLPIGLFAARSWVYISMPIAMVGGYGVYQFLRLSKKINKFLPYLVLIILIIGFYHTSYVPKEAVQHAIWPPGVTWTSSEELQGYIILRELPSDTVIYSGCQTQSFVIGFDKMSFSWIKEIRDYKERIIEDDIEDNYKFLKSYGYEYLILSSKCTQDYGMNETNEKIQEFIENDKFNLVNSNAGFLLFRVI